MATLDHGRPPATPGGRLIRFALAAGAIGVGCAGFGLNAVGEPDTWRHGTAAAMSFAFASGFCVSAGALAAWAGFVMTRRE